eukprot:580617-Lingulodinium_polyedra.AAC.1
MVNGKVLPSMCLRVVADVVGVVPIAHVLALHLYVLTLSIEIPQEAVPGGSTVASMRPGGRRGRNIVVQRCLGKSQSSSGLPLPI